MPTINFIWDDVSDNVLVETDENNQVTTTYIRHPEKYGEVFYDKQANRFAYYHYDGNGSTRKLTGANHAVTKTYIFTGFGELIASPGVGSTPFAYKGAAGYYTNPVTNDIYVRARTYEPVTGRWLSKDPLGFVDGPNLYGAYFVPNALDPSGLLRTDNWEVPFNEGVPCRGDRFGVAFDWRPNHKLLREHPGRPIAIIVQQVNFICTAVRCNGDPLEGVDITYFEFWYINVGDQPKKSERTVEVVPEGGEFGYNDL